jgi:general secretion pathway protein A
LGESSGVYCEFYSFSEKPFNITPDPRYLFLSPKHQEAYNHLWFGVSERRGFIQLTGEVGCGKTTVCRSLLERLPDEYATALILNPVLTEDQMLQAIMQEFSLDVHEGGRAYNYQRLNNFLLQLVGEKRVPVLLIDEAQDLPSETLEFVRLLSNLETDNEKLIQIVLIGQPELKEILNKPCFRQLRQRITVRYHLQPLSYEETRRYVEHRLIAAGARGLPYFDKTAIKKVFRYSKGIPRLVNALADKALLAGYVNRTYKITGRLVKMAERELEGDFR